MGAGGGIIMLPQEEANGRCGKPFGGLNNIPAIVGLREGKGRTNSWGGRKETRGERKKKKKESRGKRSDQASRRRALALPEGDLSLMGKCYQLHKKGG